MYQRNYLFNGDELRDYLEGKKRNIQSEIDSNDRDYISNVDIKKYSNYLLDKYTFQTPVLLEEDQHMEDPREIEIDVRNNQDYFGFSRGSYYRKGWEINIKIPFKGLGDLFSYKPSTSSVHLPNGDVHQNEIQFSYQALDNQISAANMRHQENLKLVKMWLGWTEADIKKYNDSLEDFIVNYIQQRRAKLKSDFSQFESFGIPITRLNDVPKSYQVPIHRKEVKISKPIAKTPKKDPEPTLELETYEEILCLIQSMSLVMERSLKTFSSIPEEQIRNHFLMVLNSQFEGKATGETFNKGGKTDILIRHNNENLFIAECKFWKGEKGLIETINQLFGYLTWRDTKTAILIFNKNKNFSSVLEKIRSTLPTHDYHKKIYSLKNQDLQLETIFSYVFHFPNDLERDVYITILAFDLSE